MFNLDATYLKCSGKSTEYLLNVQNITYYKLFRDIRFSINLTRIRTIRIHSALHSREVVNNNEHFSHLYT